jgi:hypothetical protein
VNSVYGHGIRVLHPGNNKGKWSDDEISRLHILVGEHGNKWKLIGDLLGRYWLGCRDKWRTEEKNDRAKGVWSEHDILKLKEAVALNHDKPESPDATYDPSLPNTTIHWKKISDSFPDRSIYQIKSKWITILSQINKPPGGGSVKKGSKAIAEADPMDDDITPIIDSVLSEGRHGGGHGPSLLVSDLFATPAVPPPANMHMGDNNDAMLHQQLVLVRAIAQQKDATSIKGISWENVNVEGLSPKGAKKMFKKLCDKRWDKNAGVLHDVLSVISREVNENLKRAMPLIPPVVSSIPAVIAAPSILGAFTDV